RRPSTKRSKSQSTTERKSPANSSTACWAKSSAGWRTSAPGGTRIRMRGIKSMGATIIDGKALSEQIREGLKREVARLAEQGVVPGLTVVLVGDDPASQIYVRNKAASCEKIGIRSEVIRLPGDTAEAELLSIIDGLN